MKGSAVKAMIFTTLENGQRCYHKWERGVIGNKLYEADVSLW